jgi:hypothetical protein
MAVPFDSILDFKIPRQPFVVYVGQPSVRRTTVQGCRFGERSFNRTGIERRLSLTNAAYVLRAV